MPFALIFCLAAFAGVDAGGGLAAALKRHYRLASARLTKNGKSALEPGIILAVRKEGIVSFAEEDSSYATLCPTEIKEGVVQTSLNVTCTSLAPRSRSLLRVSELVCVTALEVSLNRDAVSFFLATCQPKDSNNSAGRNRALAVFHFPAGSLKRMSSAMVERVVSETLADPEAREPDGRREPAAASPGQTRDEVWQNLGAPAVIADLGDRMIYIYAKRKVFFTNGRVSAVQER